MTPINEIARDLFRLSICIAGHNSAEKVFTLPA